jgi:uncharacterized protein YbaP (TraB family)
MKTCAGRTDVLFLVVAVVSVLLLTNGHAYACPDSSRAPGMLWRITKGGVKDAAYLFGALDVRDARVFRVGSRVLSSMQACSVVASELDILDARLQQQVEHINAEMALVNSISTRIAEIAKYVDSKVRVKGSDVNDISSNYGMPMVKHLVQLGK